MRERYLSAVGGVLVIALCAGCSRFTVESSHDPAANFTRLHTYAWKPGPQPSIGDPRVSDTLVNTTVRGAVDHELTAKGYAESAPDGADFLVAYDAAVDFDSSVILINRSTVSAGGDWRAPRHLDRSTYEEGTVIVYILDRQTAQPIWRGIASGIFDPTATPEQRQPRITSALHDLFEQFPPR
jgi:hypothetical protein